MDDRRTPADHDELHTPSDPGTRDETRTEDEATVLPPPTAMAGAMAPVAGLAAVLTPGLAGGLSDRDDDSEEARAARVEADPVRDPSEPAR